MLERAKSEHVYEYKHNGRNQPCLNIFTKKLFKSNIAELRSIFFSSAVINTNYMYRYIECFFIKVAYLATDK